MAPGGCHLAIVKGAIHIFGGGMVENKLQTGQEGLLPLCLPGRHLCGLSSNVCAQGEKFRLSSPQRGWRWGSLAGRIWPLLTVFPPVPSTLEARAGQSVEGLASIWQDFPAGLAWNR